MSILCFGLSHQTAAVDVRERFAIPESALPEALLMIDLAMPRDIDPVFHNLDSVYLYDLDSLQAIAERTLSLRKRESAKCRQLIEHQVKDFQRWLERTQSSNFSSMIVALPGT
jgi:glutamyl-tRNA reductase